MTNHKEEDVFAQMEKEFDEKYLFELGNKLKFPDKEIEKGITFKGEYLRDSIKQFNRKQIKKMVEKHDKEIFDLIFACINFKEKDDIFKINHMRKQALEKWRINNE